MSAHARQARQVARVDLEIDWARCRGHGHCAELLPELVRLDPWGYPVVSDGAGGSVVPVGSEAAAERAVSWCPNLALRLRPHG